MADFLFHKVTDKEKEEIKKQAQKIITNFSKKLSKIDKKIPTHSIERKDQEREENKTTKCEDSFRKVMFENAPNKNKELIIAEKKSW